MKVICAICKGITKSDPKNDPGLVSHAFCRDCVLAWARANGIEAKMASAIESARPVIAREEPICPANR